MTLIKVINEQVKSRVDYLKLVKLADPDVVIIDPHPTTQVLAEEQAKILVGVFGRLTSCVFDIGSVTDLMTREDQPNHLKEMFAHVLAFSLAYIKT